MPFSHRVGTQHYFFGGAHLLRRTWEDFEVLAYDLFGFDADNLRQHMGRHRLTRNQVLYYCNWAHGMRHADIAAEFGVTRQAVTDSLRRLRLKWPDLFRFKKPYTESRHRLIQYDSKHDEYVLHLF